ncbi:MAG: transglutaminase-like domain-containing protein [Acidobacteriota bacterium]|nr:transglutaminase-like domain-containing protein [Acidobacteriota bacterium]MDW3228564.1 transglutaminase-like domain-containing protein [Acidobacteriota bacterium]MDY0230867.1 transglutaminase-like domain-containing protein [Candidatus Saccharicenans sp.]
MLAERYFGKKFIFLLISLISIILLASSCSRREHFLNDKAYRRLVHNQYLNRARAASGRDQELFSVMKKPLSLEEKEALEFLYAFMPLSDLANLDGEYYLEQVRIALEARRYFSWGEKIPEVIFRHFVLPYRVNNENPDRARRIFFDELKNRIKGLDMYQAALEVNHWCHEKVTYQPTDERTSAPLATVKTAYGRCGEESTFTVAALRAVSIPARQVYTPRWAHIDDNHAWVEVWVDGRWYYLGACEPEPELNMGWFTGPAKRAMMVDTTVYGQYSGLEETLQKTDLYTRINQLPIYAPTTTLKVEVRGTNGLPVAGANVDFCLYNYAEFYPIATKTTDQEGQTSLVTGLGDMIVQAYKDHLFTWAKVTAGTTETLRLTLAEPDFSPKEIDLDIIPPVVRSVESPDPAKVEENNRRLRLEDTIRQAYEASFINRDIARIFFREKGLPEQPTWDYLETSRGNWPEILDYLSALKPEEFKTGLGLLGVVTEKDLRDTRAEIFLDHLRQTPERPKDMDENIFWNYVLSPRIGRELLSSWRGYLRDKFTEGEISEFKSQPESIADWIKANLKLDTSNYYHVPLLPQGAMQLGRADIYSMKILFVAIARTLGIPAKINPVTQRPCYFDGDEWPEVIFETEDGITEVPKKSWLKIFYHPLEDLKQPIYSNHFTLARFTQGKYRTLGYGHTPSLKSFPAELQVDSGHYLLVTGNRQPDGSVLAKLKFFEVLAEQSAEIQLTLRTSFQEPAVSGQFTTEAVVYDLDRETGLNLTALTANRSFIIVLIDPDKEPTKHLMEEIQALGDQFSKWPGLVIIAVARDRIPEGFNQDLYPKLPSSSRLVYDSDAGLYQSLTQALKKKQLSLPVVISCRSNGDIIFYSEGYHLGTGEQLVKTLLWLN